MTQQARSYTLSQFTTMVGNAVRRDPALQGAWVFAELSDFRIGAGGHCYMELIEKDPRGTTIAKMRANMWASTAAGVIPRFKAATGRDLVSGMKVMMYGSATFHCNFGFSFSIAEIDPSFTLGDLERLRREILMKLQQEGVLNRNKQLPLPLAPQKIAVISASTAAGYGDFINHLNSAPEQYVFYPLLVPALMQGEQTPKSVMAALDYIESCIDLWDMVVIIRGGGSTSDLNGFDNYELARRVATFPLPIAVGIGHERDRTVLDDIAAVRCKTPTAVAGWLIDALRESWTRAYTLTDKILADATAILKAETQRYANLEALLPVMVQKRIADQRIHLGDLSARIPGNALRLISSEQARLNRVVELIPLAVETRTAKGRTMLNYTQESIERAARANLDNARMKLKGLEDVTAALDPSATLRRGFSVTRVNGHAVTDPDNVSDGDIIETQLAAGTLISRKINEN